MHKKKTLRSGYTTGACAAAAAKAATMLLLKSKEQRAKSKDGNNLCPEVEIPFPDGSRHKFKIHDTGYRRRDKIAWVSVIKDAGDDPDVTNGAEIRAEVRIQDKENYSSCIRHHELAIIKGGKGVGVVTKPGLPVPVGEPAINPVPRKMIKEAVLETISSAKAQKCRSAAALGDRAFEITISVPGGERLAKKTLNNRLGIIGGLSILGTTGIVRPVSSAAWTATITASMDVAKAMGQDEIVLSAGRSSEKAHIDKFNLAEESYVMMGDYLEFSLLEAKRHGFKKIHLCSQWAKMLKIAMATPQTHVRHGAIDVKKTVEFLKGFGIGDLGLGQEFNTAMEIFNFINLQCATRSSQLFNRVCIAAKKYAEGIAAKVPVVSYLVSYEGQIIASSE